MKRPESEPHVYKPGQIVPISGLYTAIHEGHRSSHEVVAIRGEEFPQCRLCKDEVRFCITKGVPHMMHDFDLTGPEPITVQHRARAAKKGSH